MSRLSPALWLLLLSTVAVAQIDERQLLRQGMKLESEGQIEAAITIYERLLNLNTRNVSVIYRLASTYQHAGRFDDGIRLLQARLEQTPGDITAINRLADIHFAAGNIDEADRQIDRILQISPNQGAYTSAGQRYERMNQDTKAAAVYLRGREALREPGLFSRELAQIHERAEDYPSAVREYGTLARRKPQYVTLVESKLKGIATVAPDPDPLFDLLLQDVKGAHRDSRTTRLFITFAISSGLASEALDAILILPHDAQIEGSLLRIGRETLDYGDPGDAVRAFDALAVRSRNRSLRAQAAAGTARAYDLLGRTEDALTAYREILSASGDAPGRDESAYRLGDLLWRTGQHDRAIDTLRILGDARTSSSWRVRAIDLLGDIHLARGKPEEAAHWFGRNLSENRGREDGITASYKLGRLYMMGGVYTTARKALASVLNGGLATLVYNDAIELSDIIDTGLAEDTEGLDTFAESLRLEVRGDRRRAADTALATRTGGALTDRLYRRGIEITMEDTAWTDAERAIRKMLSRQTALASWATYTLGRCLESQGRKEEAIVVYESVLVTYPLTLEADRSRERLTDLRADESPKRETG